MARIMTKSRATLLIVGAALAACGFDPSATPNGRPDASAAGDVSDVDTRPAGDAEAGNADAHDASVSASDATVTDATPSPVTLTETATDVLDPSVVAACGAPNPGTTADAQWYRVFQLTGSAGFAISAVTFRPDGSKNANGISVTVSDYTGAVGAATIDVTKEAGSVSASVDVANGEAQPVIVPIVKMIPAGGRFVVEISAPNLNQVGSFLLGETLAAETEPGYFSSGHCAIPIETIAQFEAQNGTPAGHLILDVTGTPAP